MDAEKKTTPAAPSLERLVCSSLPPLDPNGQPFSMVLRGTVADLGDLRAALTSYPDARQQLQLELQMNAKDADDKFGDDDIEGMAQAEQSGGFQGGHGFNTQQQAETEAMGDGNDDTAENKKRSREDGGDDGGIDVEDECDDDVTGQEQLLFYLPSVQCTCSSWKMEDVPGDMFVTTVRVLFLPENQDGEAQCDDVAIDGSCIALHAVDSLPGENEANISHHVYCQLAEPMGEESDMGYTSAISMIAPTNIVEENGDNFNGDGDEQEEEEEEEDGSSEEDGTIEVYFKPVISDEEEKNGNESQSNKCQSIFDSLTKLASLNPAGDSDEGCGGLFSMLSLMAGLGNASNGFDGEMVIAGQDDESDDDMVVRLGGSNNLVENDDENEGAPNEERQAMLRRLDDMLVVPPEYEIASSDEGQFDDAEEDDDDEIL